MISSPGLNATGRFSSIRLCGPQDIQDLLSSGDNSRYWKEAGFPDKHRFESLIRNSIVNHPPDPQFRKSWLWAIDSKAEPCIGMVYFCETHYRVGEGLAGIFKKKNRKQILSLESIILVIDMILSKLGYSRISATVRPNNLDALKFWMGLGFRIEGSKPQEYYQDKGPAEDFLLGLLKDDFYSLPVVRRMISWNADGTI